MRKTIRIKKNSLKLGLGAFAAFLISIFAGLLISPNLQNVLPDLSAHIGKDVNFSVEAQASQANEECKDSHDKNRCYPEFFYKLTQKTDHKFASEALSKLQQINPQETRGCHFIAHKISQAEVEKDPEGWERILQEVSPSLCTGGFLHGVLEVHIADDPEFVINEENILAICRDIIGVKSKFGERSCFHSMGHLLLTETGGSIPEAVSQCEKIGDFPPRYECLSGAFMENITQENLFDHGYVKKRDPWNEEKTRRVEKLCLEYEGDAALACWKEISYLYFAISFNDPVGMYEECQNAPEQRMRDECFIYGAGNLVNTIRFKEEDLYVTCHQFPSEHYLFDRCMKQITGSLITGTIDNIDRVMGLCEQTYPEYKQKCYAKIIQTLQNNKENASIIQSTCGKFPEEVRRRVCAG